MFHHQSSNQDHSQDISLVLNNQDQTAQAISKSKTTTITKNQLEILFQFQIKEVGQPMIMRSKDQQQLIHQRRIIHQILNQINIKTIQKYWLKEVIIILQTKSTNLKADKKKMSKSNRFQKLRLHKLL